MPKNNLLIIIPAWNEEKSIISVLDSVQRAVPNADCLVVNDGSTDNTADVVRAAGVAVLDLPINLGVGGAMRAGFRYAVRKNYQYAVQVDADGQHDPIYINQMLELAKQGADVVIGARFAGVGAYEARGPRRWAMVVFAKVISSMAHTKLTDVTSGFKLYSRRALDFFSENYPAEYLGDTIEALVLGTRYGLHITQIGVEMHERTDGVPSHSPIKAMILLFRASLALTVALISRKKKVRS